MTTCPHCGETLILRVHWFSMVVALSAFALVGIVGLVAMVR